jgi:hypothetical protein
MYFAQERLYYSVGGNIASLGAERFLRIFAVITIFITVLLSIFTSRVKYHYSIQIAFFLLILVITLNYLFSGAGLGDVAALMSTRGIGTWFCLGLVLVSYNEKRFSRFKKFTYLSIIVISLLSFYNFFDFGIGLWRGQALSKYRIYATNMVWIAPYVFLILKGNKKLTWLRLLALGMGIVLALITQTRSFLIIYFLTILFDFYNTKNKAVYSVLITVLSIGMIILVFNTEMLSNSLDLLINRGTNDTRSEQLNVFISQLNFFELITGKGHYATYGFGSQQWAAVDNQWLYLFWWAGLIPVISFFYLTAFIPIKLIFRGKLTYETKVECFLLILWSLGLFGLAIYTTVKIDLFFFVISVVLGRLLFKYSNQKKNVSKTE